MNYKFGDAPGLPANEHKRKAIQEKKAKDKEAKKIKLEKFSKQFYTVINGKVLLLTIRPNGLYRSFFDSVKKLGPDLLKTKIKKWKDSGKWMDEHAIEDLSYDLISKMQDDMAREK